MKKLLSLFLLPLVSAYHPGTSGANSAATKTLVDQGNSPMIAMGIFLFILGLVVYWKIKNGK